MTAGKSPLPRLALCESAAFARDTLSSDFGGDSLR
jgi:hypothetical protein